jgi:hypothetical protein
VVNALGSISSTAKEKEKSTCYSFSMNLNPMVNAFREGSKLWLSKDRISV